MREGREDFGASTKDKHKTVGKAEFGIIESGPKEMRDDKERETERDMVISDQSNKSIINKSENCPLGSAVFVMVMNNINQ